MKLKIKELEGYEVEAVAFPIEEAPEGSTEETKILTPVVILPQGMGEEKVRVAEVLMEKKDRIFEKVGSNLLKVIVKPIKV